MTNKSSHPFTVFAASAGSGKTYALVKNYLLKVLQGPQKDNYKSLLAITFTNKAVAEMKNRILAQLELYANYKDRDELHSMQHDLCAELDIKPHILAIKSKEALKDILHNYGSFAVETIDSFNHRILRTFARDLGLRSDFEVTTEADLLLQQAVEGVLAKTDQDEFLTTTLVNFAIQKIQEDRSWDPTHQLLEKSKILLQEQSLEPLQRLQTKTIEDFKALTKTVRGYQQQASLKVKAYGEQALHLIGQQQLEFEHFTGKGYLPKHFEKLAKGQSVKWEAKWQLNIEDADLYTKTQEDWVKSAIDSIRPELIDLFIKAKEAYLEADWYSRIYREIVPLTVLNYIQNEYEAIKKEQNLVTVAEFNKRIHKEVAGQPVPFIYERLGDKYRHFFIDEFQDTSQMQWQNLLPLAENALAQADAGQQQGSLLLVGDAKQSIYRWRGGEPEQFLKLSHGESPFFIPAQLTRLTKNWRSYSEIIEFNNALFKHLGTHLEAGSYRELYTEESAQLVNDNTGGLVSLEFFEASNNTERAPIYIDKVFERIEACLEQGYALKDICILTRKKEHSKLLAQALEEKYAVVSPDSLLLKESAMVQFLLSGLSLAHNPSDAELRLDFLWNYLVVTQAEMDAHKVLSKAKDKTAFYRVLDGLGVGFSMERFNSYGLYESLEYLIRAFKLQDQVSSYERHFLDLARNFEQQNSSGTLSFLEDWKKQEDAASLQFPETLNALRLMTVHKAKGLEFPVVIVPFTDADLINTRNESLWYPVKAEQYCGFSEFHLPLNCLKEHDPEVYDSYLRQRFFDELNVYYVALTRAEEELHILSSAKNAGNKTFGSLLLDYLEQLPEYDADKQYYQWGNPMNKGKKEAVEQAPANTYISTDKLNNKIRLVASPRDKYQRESNQARERGNRLHLWLSRLSTADELPQLFEQLEVLARYDSGQLEQDRQLLQQLIDHPEMAPYFAIGVDSRNEADIVDQDGNLHRPDRLVFEGDSVVIIDYKFGSVDPSYKEQLDRYQTALQNIGYTTKKKILAYVGDKIELQTW